MEVFAKDLPRPEEEDVQMRLASPLDLPALKAMFAAITEKMNAAYGEIWNEYYPTEVFPEDVENHRLYVLEQQGTLLAAFALCEAVPEEDGLGWTEAPAYFCNRMGVRAQRQAEGLGQLALQHAVRLAKAEGARYLRAVVVDRNRASLALCEKAGFYRVSGLREEYIREDLTLREYGFELELK